MKTMVKLLSLMAFLFAAGKSYAFPTTIRHGYTSCFTCHYSPQGGGALKPYGKIIAGELYGRYNWFSTKKGLWLKQPEENEKYTVSLMARGSQVHSKVETSTKETTTGKFVTMQFDVEAVGHAFGLYGAVTAGFKGDAGKSSGGKTTDGNVRRIYVGKYTTKYAFRVGKFYPDFGIRHPNHNIPTRGGLYFNQGDEPIVGQLNLFYESYDFAVSYFKGEKNTSLNNQVGVTASAIYKTPHTRSGISILSSNADTSETTESKSAYSLYTHLGYGDGYTLAEIANKKDTASGTTDRESDLVYIESGWEFWKGIIPYIGYQHTGSWSQHQFTRAPTFGFRFYPMTHSEVVVQYSPIETESNSGSSTSQFAFAMFNLYF